MLKVWDFLLTIHGIPYWIDGGTLLGAVRHQGQIPWDDDADLEVYASDWPRILELEKEFIMFGFEFRGYSIRVQGQEYPWVDILLTEKNPETNIVSLIGWCKETWPNNWFHESELFPGQRVNFGPIKLHAPSNPERYLKQLYGSDCMEWAICYTHNGFNHFEKVKIVDFKPAPYLVEDPRIPLD